MLLSTCSTAAIDVVRFASAPVFARWYEKRFPLILVAHVLGGDYVKPIDIYIFQQRGREENQSPERAEDHYQIRERLHLLAVTGILGGGPHSPFNPVVTF